MSSAGGEVGAWAANVDHMPTGNPDDDDDMHVLLEGPEDAVANAQAEVSCCSCVTFI